MRRVLLPAVAATAVLALVGGCAEDERLDCSAPPTADKIRGEALPVVVKPSQTFPGADPKDVDSAVPAPDGFPSISEQVLIDLRRRTLTAAGRIGEIDAGRCEDKVAGKVGSTTRCTVTYEGEEARWLIEITGVGPGVIADVEYEYTPRLEQGVLTADMVYEQLAWNTKEGYDRLPARCEELPDLFTAEPGKSTGYHCQRLGYSCTDGVEKYWWEDNPVGIDEEGFVTFTAPD